MCQGRKFAGNWYYPGVRGEVLELLCFFWIGCFIVMLWHWLTILIVTQIKFSAKEWTEAHSWLKAVCSFICLGSVLIKLRLTTVLLCLQKLLTIGVSMVANWHPTGSVHWFWKLRRRHLLHPLERLVCWAKQELLLVEWDWKLSHLLQNVSNITSWS